MIMTYIYAICAFWLSCLLMDNGGVYVGAKNDKADDIQD